jgi:subtilisin family serine protease
MNSIIKKLLYASIIFVLVLGTGASNVTAQNPAPEKLERIDKSAISLDEVENYYGLLSQRTGPIQVVVELAGASVVEYRSTFGAGSSLNAVTQTKAQLNRVQQSQANFLQSADSAGIAVDEIYRVQRVYNGVALAVDSTQLKALSQLSGIKAIYPLIPKTLDHTTSVPLINAPQVWGGSAAYQGDGITIGVIDSGIDYLHTNFGGPGTGYDTKDFTTNEAGGGFPSLKVVGGYDFVGDNYDASGLSGSIVPSPDPDPMDCGFHGTHVAGSAAGLGVKPDGATFDGDYATLKDLSSDEYISQFRIGPGVAPKASLYALRVFGCSGNTNLVDVAVEWAIDPNGDGDISDHLDVINLSLGSSYGSEYDTSAIAVNNAVLAGIIVVTSAGNSGDVNYINGSPGVARNVISVANSVDSGTTGSGFSVTSPADIAGVYLAADASFGADLATAGPVAGALVYSTPANGCVAFSNAAAVSGNIALIDRGTCSFTVKVKNAQLAGATGVLILNDLPGYPFDMSGVDATITIPSQMASLDVGNVLKGKLASVPVTVNLTAEYRGRVDLVPSLNDTLAVSSSRGIRRVDNGLKPDISAPGTTIYSADTGSGDQGLTLSGTSMASPHVAGVMALLRQEHPGWSVEELKARVMNTATNDLYTGSSKSGNKFTPSRIGAGRVDVFNAVAIDQVIAFNKADPGAVSVSFGSLEVVETNAGADQTFTKIVTVKNKGAIPQSYTAMIDLSPSYQSNAGVAFSLLDSSGAALVNPVTVPAGGSVDLQIKLAVDSSLLQRRRDASMAADGGRSYLTETGGYLTLKPAAAPPAIAVTGQPLRLPVHATLRPASGLASAVAEMSLPSGMVGSFPLPLTGARVMALDDIARTSVFELKGISPNEDSSQGLNNNADLQYVGVMADTPLYNFSDVYVYLGLSTYGEWSTPKEVEMYIYIDSDEDGTPDYVVYNGAQSDTFFSVICLANFSGCVAGFYLNGYAGSTNTNVYNSSVLMLPVPAGGIGLSPTNTDFNFKVVTWNRESDLPVDEVDWMSYDIEKMALDTNDAVLTGFPVWALPVGSEITVNFDKNNLEADDIPLGLLLLHHHNTTGSQAEIVNIPNSEASLTPAVPMSSNLPGKTANMGLLLENKSSFNCTFDLSYSSLLGWEIVGPTARTIPAGSKDLFNVAVKIAHTALPGSAVDTIGVTAFCQDKGVFATASFEAQARYAIRLPIITR